PLPDLADASRRELVALAVLADETRVLEELGHPAELVEGLPRRGSREALDLLAVERLEVVGVARATDRVLHVRELVHFVHESEGLGQRKRLVAGHRVVVAVHWHELTERLSEIVHRVLQAGIVEGRAEQLLELRAHVRGHGLPERTHRGHALRELAKKIVPVLRASGELRVLPLERLEVRLSAL